MRSRIGTLGMNGLRLNSGEIKPLSKYIQGHCIPWCLSQTESFDLLLQRSWQGQGDLLTRSWQCDHRLKWPTTGHRDSSWHNSPTYCDLHCTAIISHTKTGLSTLLPQNHLTTPDFQSQDTQVIHLAFLPNSLWLQFAFIRIQAWGFPQNSTFTKRAFTA